MALYGPNGPISKPMQPLPQRVAKPKPPPPPPQPKKPKIQYLPQQAETPEATHRQERYRHVVTPQRPLTAHYRDGRTAPVICFTLEMEWYSVRPEAGHQFSPRNGDRAYGERWVALVLANRSRSDMDLEPVDDDPDFTHIDDGQPR